MCAETMELHKNFVDHGILGQEIRQEKVPEMVRVWFAMIILFNEFQQEKEIVNKL